MSKKPLQRPFQISSSMNHNSFHNEKVFWITSSIAPFQMEYKFREKYHPNFYDTTNILVVFCHSHTREAVKDMTERETLELYWRYSDIAY